MSSEYFARRVSSIRASSEYAARGIRRRPESSAEGVDTSTILTSGLSGDGLAALDGGESVRGGRAPQPASSNVANAVTTPNLAWRNKMCGNGTESLMIRLVACMFACLTLSLPAHAALDIGERAPDFTAPA